MSDDQSTQSNNSGTTDGNAGQNPPSPQQPSPPAPQQTQTPHQNPNSDLIKNFTDTLNALPETIARSVKEVIGTPASNTNSTSQANSSTGKENEGGSSQGSDKGTESSGGKSPSTGHAAATASVPGNQQQPTKLARWWFS